ncbi:MAG: hypothetical protein IPG58_17460 [Acidobacteria bacterium]|nr:hypothetical protein [Acidobacteriota bacterium]
MTGAQSVLGLTINTGGVLTLSGGSTIHNGRHGREFVLWWGTVNGTGIFRSQGITSLSFSNFTAPVEIVSGTTTANGTLGGSLTILSGATLNTTNQTITVNGDLNVNAGGIVTKTSNSFNAGGANIVNNGTITGGSFNFLGTGIQNFSGSGSLQPR